MSVKHVVAMMVAMQALPALAFEYPKPPQPEAQAAIEQFKQDFAKLSADKAFFDAPSPEPAWPCQIDQVPLYTAAGLTQALPGKAEEMEKMVRKQMREMGTDLAPPKTEIHDIHIVPLKVSCTGGVADGPAELLVSFRQTNTSTSFVNSPFQAGQRIEATNVVSTEQRSRKTVIFKNGALGGTVDPQVSELRTKMQLTYSDPRMQEAAAKNAIPSATKPTLMLIYSKLPGLTGATFSVSPKPTVSAGLFGASVDWDQLALNSGFVFPAVNGITRQEGWRDNLPSMKSTARDGKQDGEQLIYFENSYKKAGLRIDQIPGMENAREVTIDGTDMIEQHNCFVEGVLTKVAECTRY